MELINVLLREMRSAVFFSMCSKQLVLCGHLQRNTRVGKLEMMRLALVIELPAAVAQVRMYAARPKEQVPERGGAM